MTVEHIIPCICSQQQEKEYSRFDGMPQLKVSGNYIKHLQFWQIYCPNCGRGGCREFKSPYLALKDWNKMQKTLYGYENKEIFIRDRDFYLSLNKEQE